MLIMRYFLGQFGLMFFLFVALSSCKKDGDEGSSVNDFEKPVITILGDNPYYTQKDSSYTDPGATAHDNIDGNITSNIVVTNNVNVNVEGDYTVNYMVADIAGNVADTFRVVKVQVFK